MTSPEGAHASPTQTLALPDVQQIQRPHPATALVRGWIAVLAIGLYSVREILPSLIDTERESGDQPWRQFGGPTLIALGVVLVGTVAAMAATWYFTRFVIDEQEFRLETGALWRSSRRIPFTKIQGIEVYQPFAARIFGLAELTIDAGADHPVRLRYLRRDDAYRFRDYLLTRAHGQRSGLDDRLAPRSVLQDVSDDDEVITRISPGTLILAALLSLEVLVTLIVVALGIIPSVVSGYGWVTPALMIAWLLASIPYLNRVTLTQFNYVLARSGRGIKITRGLTSLTSQTIPAHRIQALRVSQPIFWRPLGLYRVDMDLVGVHAPEMSESGTQGTSLLMPAGTLSQVNAALSAIWPGADPAAVTLHRSPRRAHWLRPVSAKTLRYGADDLIAITSSGILRRRWDYVPHKRVQSICIVEGPLQRRLRLADVQVHTVGRNVSMVAKHLSPEDAREFAVAQGDAAINAPSDGTVATVSTEQGPAPALGWPGESARPDPALGFPHLTWR